MSRFAEKRGTGPVALKELGDALTREMPGIVADLRTKFLVTQPATMDDIPPELREEWIAADGRVRLHVSPATDIGNPEAMRVFTEAVQTVSPAPAGAPASVTGAGEAILRAFAEAIAYTVISIGL